MAKRPPLRIDTYDEMMGQAGMSGFDALLRTTPEELQALGERYREHTLGPVLVTPTQESTGVVPTGVVSTPVIETPVAITGAAATPVETTPVKAIPVEDTPVELTVVETTGVVSESIRFFGRPTAEPKLYRIQRAQDALTKTEEAVYDFLWGVRNQNPERSRCVSIGFDRLGQGSRVTSKNAKLIVHRLIDKGFVEIVTPADIATRTPTVYRVFSYGACLERIRNKGHQFVIRKSTGVFYAETTPVETTPVPSTPAPSTRVNSTGENADSLKPASTPVVSKTTPVASTPDILKGIYFGRELPTTTTSSDLLLVAAAIRSATGTVDDDAARTLITRCRERAGDATAQEISEMIASKSAVMRKLGNRISNPVGFLITTVPPCFEGESFRLFRQARAEQTELQAREDARLKGVLEEFKAEQQRVLDDPFSSESDKEFAMQYLAGVL